jgi:hypothetical protein
MFLARDFRTRDAVISFRCAPEDKGVIAEPVPAKSVLPDWFRKLPPVDKTQLSPTRALFDQIESLRRSDFRSRAGKDPQTVPRGTGKGLFRKVGRKAPGPFGFRFSGHPVRKPA